MRFIDSHLKVTFQIKCFRVMMNIDIYYLDLIGTAVFAYGGAAVTRERGFSIVTVCVLGIATAVGGGTVRHFLLQTDNLFWIDDIWYLLVCAVAIALAYLTPFELVITRIVFRFIDNLSIAIFISIGFTIAADVTNSLFIGAALGLITGIGGRLIRDTLTVKVPSVFSDPIIPYLLLAICLGIYVANSMGFESWIGSCLGVALVQAGWILSRDTRTTIIQNR